MTEHETPTMGAMGAQLANVLADKARMAIGEFPASTSGERAAIAREVAAQLTEYADDQGS